MKKVIFFLFFLLIIPNWVIFGSTSKKENKKLTDIFILPKEPGERLKIKKYEKILKEMKKFYTDKNYEKVIELLKKIPPEFSLTPEKNLIISESYLKIGHPEKAIRFANKVISVKRGTYQACLAFSLKNKALIIKGDYKKAEKELKNFLHSYCPEKSKKEAKILLYFIKSFKREQIKGIEKPLIKKTLGEIYLLRGIYFLNRKKFGKAKNDFFIYLNIYGTYKDAPQLIYKLAEAYFKNKKIDKAKNLYELIITEWSGTKEDLLSKFRLYQIAYETALIKELLPPKTKRDLLNYIHIIKTRYPKEKIAEEAAFLEIKIYAEDKNYPQIRKNAIKFFELFEESPFINKVKKFYCLSVNDLLKNYYQTGELLQILNTEKNR